MQPVNKDPALSRFMSFLASDMRNLPGHLTPLDNDILNRIDTLVREVKASPEEDLGDTALI